MGRFVTRTSISQGGGGGSGDLGSVVAYAAFSLATTGLKSIDLSQTFPAYVGGDASVTYNAAYGVGGGGGVRCYPPATSGEYSGIGQLNLFNAGGSVNFTNLYMRWCVRVGSAWADNNEFDAVKHLILWSSGGPNSTANDPERPMVYFDSRPGELAVAPADSTTICPAQGTSRYFAEGAPDEFPEGDGDFDFYLGQSATTYLGKRVIDDADFVCIELLCESAQTGSHPNGTIHFRVTARDGTVLSDLDPDWNHDAAVPFTKYFTTVDVLGGYYNGLTDAAGANNYIELDRYVSFERDGNTFRGPPPGFLT
jgi:hypothetical protein